MVASGGKVAWIGRVVSILVALIFAFSAIMKFVGGEALAEGMKHLGLSETMTLPLAILELTCVVVYLIPSTSIMGAILLTGYIGGAILTHWRVGDYVFIHILIGICIWLGLWLREARLKELIPLRR